MLTLIYDNAILYLNETAAVQKYTIYLEHFTMREGGGILNYIKNDERRRNRHGFGNQNVMGSVFTAPPVLLFFILTFIPIIMAVVISFTDYDIVNAPRFVGLYNYRKMINDEFFWIALKNTCVYTLLYVPGGLLLSLGAALYLNVNRKFVSVFRTLFYLPVLSSTVATATLWFWILNPQLGLLNGVLELFGISGPAWLYDSRWAMLAVVMMSLWAGFGTNMMIFLSGLKGVSQSLYEAARVEGANRWQIFTHITWPSISKTTFLVTTMLIISSFQVFDQAFILTRGGPGNATITLVYYIYNNGFNNLNMGYASSISMVLFLIILVFSVMNTRLNNADI